MHLMDRCWIHHFDDDDVYSCPAEGGPRGVTAGGRNKSGNNASGVSVSARNYSASDNNEFRRVRVLPFRIKKFIEWRFSFVPQNENNFRYANCVIKTIM